MILDQLARCETYSPLHPLLARGFAWLRTEDAQSLPPGRYEIEGEKLFAIVDEYTTKPVGECRLEAHRKYWDIQYMVRGVERIGYAPLERAKVVEAYNPAKDVAFYEGEWDPLTLRAGMFAVFGPLDGHAPQIAAGKPAPVRKVVIKAMI